MHVRYFGFCCWCCCAGNFSLFMFGTESRWNDVCAVWWNKYKQVFCCFVFVACSSVLRPASTRNVKVQSRYQQIHINEATDHLSRPSLLFGSHDTDKKKGCLFNVTRKWMKKHGPTTHKVNNENRECEREKNKQCMPTNMNNVKMYVLLRNKAHGVHCGAVWCTIALVPHRNSPHTCMCCTMHSDETSHYSQIAHWAPQQDMHHLSVFGHKRKCHDGF